MAVAFVFPGQGSQTVGMGKTLAANFPVAQQVFDEVDDALGSKLSAIIFEGPADTLTLTEHAQPALMAMSLAVFRVLQSEAGLDLARDAKFVAGHSLGGALALMATAELANHDDPDVRDSIAACYTFGCPRAGDASFDLFVKAPLYRITNGVDLVPAERLAEVQRAQLHAGVSGQERAHRMPRGPAAGAA